MTGGARRAGFFLRSGNLVLRFLLELCNLGALAYWGVERGSTTLVKLALGIGLPLAAAVFWGAFVAPKALLGGSRALRLALGLVVFFLAAAALVNTGHTTIGWAFGAVALVNTLLTYVFGPQPGETSPPD